MLLSIGTMGKFRFWSRFQDVAGKLAPVVRGGKGGKFGTRRERFARSEARDARKGYEAAT